MYKYITIAYNTRQVWAVPMYIYQHEDNNKYYITRTYPKYSRFDGDNLNDPTTYNEIDFAKEISNDDVKKGFTNYWNQDWKFRLTS
jgi:hypothetical protein